MQKILSFFLVFLFAITTSHAHTKTESQELKEYAKNLVNEEYKNFNDNTLSPEEKKANTKQFISENLYLDWMARTSLGRHRRALSKHKLKEFIQAYSKFVIKTYTELSTSYSGEKAVLKKIKQIDENMFIANMEIIKPNGQPPIKIDYLVHEIEEPKHKYLVGDIITEGISTLNSQQAEFNSIISSNGIDALITDLTNRTNAAN